jgi:hypothetical protein
LPGIARHSCVAMRLIHFRFGDLHAASGGAFSFPDWGLD